MLIILFFVTFNYTNTLESLYNISDSSILHIHGKDDKIWGNHYNQITKADEFEINVDYINPYYEEGTGEWNDETENFEEYPSNLSKFRETVSYGEQEVDNSIDTIALRLEEMNSEMVKKLQLKELKNFIESIPEVEEIIVLGMSIGEVDVPYFESLNKLCPNVTWFISFYQDTDIVCENVKKLTFQVQLEQFDNLFKL
ncbi:TPA: AbiH family protein [Streptococcus suis]